VQADAQPGVRARVLCGLHRGRPPNHQAGARDNSLFVRECNAAIDASAAAEIVGIDDESSPSGTDGHAQSIKGARGAIERSKKPSRLLAPRSRNVRGCSRKRSSTNLKRLA